MADHVRTYVESGGKKGHRWSGMNTLLITTRGRQRGLLRRTALIYGRDDERYVVVGSNGGKKTNPAWHHNLLADPRLEVQVGEETFSARARLATEEERPQLWAMMAKIFPQYGGFQKKTKREIPVVVIERD